MSMELQVLTRAREMVADGWMKGSAYGMTHDGKKSRCAGQAITDAYIEVSGTTPSRPPCLCGGCTTHGPWDGFNRCIEAFTVVTGDPSIPAWNDAGGRTHEAVLLAFDRAIERLQRLTEVEVIEVPVPKAEYHPIYTEGVVPEMVFDTITVEAPKVGMIESGKKKVLELLGV